MDFSSTSDILSLIAIIVSIASAGYQWYLDSHMNKTNLEADYFKELFLESILNEFPKARVRLRFSNEKLVDIDMLIDQLNLIRRKSLYYRYADNDFYTDLKIGLQALEDYLVRISGKKISPEKQNKVLEHINKKMEEIYRILNDKYIGKY